MSRSAFWSFTINNYTEEEFGHLLSLDSSQWCVVFGKEKAPTTGTPHLQGCIWSFDESRKKRRTVEIALGGRAWLEPTHNLWACVGYSIKDGDFYDNLHCAEDLNRLRDVIKKASEFGKENSWLGAVYFNEDEVDQLAPAYEMFKWNESC